MKVSLLKVIICPHCENDLTLSDPSAGDTEEITEGSLVCSDCDRNYPINKGVPNFCYKTDSSSNKLKTKKMFEYEWSQFEKEESNFNKTKEREYTEFIEKCDLVPNQVFEHSLVVDSGCGTGSLASEIARRNPHCIVIGVDITKGVEKAQESYHDISNLHFVQADIFCMPFKDNSIDMLYSIGVLHHIKESKKAFREVSMIVKNNGILCLMVYSLKNRYFKYFFHIGHGITKQLPLCILKFLSTVLSKLFKAQSHYIFDFLAPPYTRIFDQETISDWYEKEGFSDIAINHKKSLWCKAVKK